MLTASFALELIIKSTILLTIANLLAYMWRRKSARARMLLWRTTAVALLLLPVLSWFAARSISARLDVLPSLISMDAANVSAAQIINAPGITQWLCFLWIGGAMAILLWILAAHWLVWRVIRPHVRAADTRVVTSPHVAGPVAWGLFRPRVLLPSDSHRWDPERLEIVVAHETTHVNGRDCFWQFVAQLATALYWFHPLAWRLLAHLREETEFYCDEVLLALGYRPSAYAETLLAFASATSRLDSLCPVTVAVARRTTIGRRIQRILTMENRHRFTRASAVAAVLAVSLVFPIAAMQAGKSDTKVYKIGQGVKAPIPIYKEQPRYTPEAKEAKIQGTVRLEIVVNTEGHVAQVDLINGLDPGLDKNAIDAVKTWTFEPATKDGKPVNVKATIEINFKLV